MYICKYVTGYCTLILLVRGKCEYIVYLFIHSMHIYIMIIYIMVVVVVVLVSTCQLGFVKMRTRNQETRTDQQVDISKILLQK